MRTSLGLQPYADEDYEQLHKIKLGSIVKAKIIMPRSCHDCLFSEGICDDMPVGADPDTFRCSHYEWKYS